MALLGCAYTLGVRLVLVICTKAQVASAIRSMAGFGFGFGYIEIDHMVQTTV